MSLDTELGPPEPPTNRPLPPGDRLGKFLARPYMKRIIVISIIATLAWIPVAYWLAESMGGGPAASKLMHELKLTVFVFTVVSAPLMGFVIAVILYSWLGWGRVSGDAVPDLKNPAIRTNPIAITLWTIVVSVLAFFLVGWGIIEYTVVQNYAQGSDNPNNAPPLRVEVTGQQWVWTFTYPEHGNVTSEYLYLEHNRPVTFAITSKDVIHNFWIVPMGVKMDANPGEVTFAGVTPDVLGSFPIRCAELCGMHHAFMQTDAVVLSKEDFNSWLASQGADTSTKSASTAGSES
jgi:cytochrome c oxidase subunit 2